MIPLKAAGDRTRMQAEDQICKTQDWGVTVTLGEAGSRPLRFCMFLLRPLKQVVAARMLLSTQ